MPATTGVHPEQAKRAEGLPHTFACSTIGPAGLNLRRFAGVSERSLLAGARSRNPERSLRRISRERAVNPPAPSSGHVVEISPPRWDNARMRNGGLVLLLVLACCQVLCAQTALETYSSSGNAFLRLCSPIDDDKATPGEQADVIGCVGFVSGFMVGAEAETALVKSKIGRKTPEMFCRPNNIEHGQVVRIVLKYIRSHPEEAHRVTELIMVSALGEAFPCKSWFGK
jgi:hypothetical protein